MGMAITNPTAGSQAVLNVLGGGGNRLLGRPTQTKVNPGTPAQAQAAALKLIQEAEKKGKATAGGGALGNVYGG